MVQCKSIGGLYQIATVDGGGVDPAAVFKDILAGTSFQNDPVMQAHLNDFSRAFKATMETSEGQYFTILSNL